MSASRPAPFHEAGGLYGPGSEAWRLNREATLLLAAGPRALLMQIAHPLVAEGVNEHSGFREDPWGRLLATLRSYLTIVYGSGTEARSEIARLNRLHTRIRGPVVDPVARETSGAGHYRARDPALSMWVHATLVDSTFVGYGAWLEPLSRSRRSRAYEETRPIGRALGIGDDLLPADLGAFESYMDAMLAPSGPIVVTPTARQLAQTILHPPLGPAVDTLASRFPFGPRAAPLTAPLRSGLAAIPSAAYDWTMWPALALLPPRLRAEFGIDWTTWHALVADWLVAGFRFWRPLVPRWLRSMPQALAADRRMVAAAEYDQPRHALAEAGATREAGATQ